MSGVTKQVRTIGIILCLTAIVLIFIPAVRACEWRYVIWAIRDKRADPLFRFVRKGKAGYIDSSGKIVIQPRLPGRENALGEFHEGLLAMREGHGFRYLDRNGLVAFRLEVWAAYDFSEGLAAASQDIHTFLWGFVDRGGHFVIPPRYLHVESFSEGLARVSVSGELGSTGYVNRLGGFVIPPRLTYGSSFHEGRAAVIIGGPCQFTNGGSCERAEFRPLMVNAKYDCRYAFVDKSGEPISDLRFDDAKDFSEDLAPVRVGRQWGYVDNSGQMVISPKFESAEPFSEGVAAVRQAGRIGFIDRSGGFTIRPQFMAAESFSDGRALVSDPDDLEMSTSRYITKTGLAAFPGSFAVASSFSYGLAHVALSGVSRAKYAWIDTSGKPVFTYDPR
jgi:hypothetical protein